MRSLKELKKELVVPKTINSIDDNFDFQNEEEFDERTFRSTQTQVKEVVGSPR